MKTRTQALRAGFTLAELMVVIVIIGLLATLVVPNVMSKLFQANITKAKADIVNISSGVEEWAMLNGGTFPESLESLVQKDENGHSILNADVVPKDPWGNPYVYEPPQGGQPFRVISYGRDGSPGGESDDKDLDNVMIRNGEI